MTYVPPTPYVDLPSMTTPVWAADLNRSFKALASCSNIATYAADYGAVGDDSTDDTVALQNALNAVVAGNVTNAVGGTLHLAPNHNYKITSALTWPSNVSIHGHGSSIHQTTANANALVSTDGSYLGLRDITIRGPVSGSPSGTGKGIVCQRSVNQNVRASLWEQVVVHSFGSDGIWISNPITSTFYNVEARSCAGHGWNIQGGIGGGVGTSLAFNACFGNGNTQAGFHLQTTAYCSFSACAADSNGIGYEVINGQGTSFNGCGAESQVDNSGTVAGYGGYSWKINGGFGNCLIGCWTLNQPSISVWITGSAATVVILGFTENTPASGSTHCIQNDSGCTTTTLGNISNVKSNNTSAATILINDGGGLSVPGYGFFGGTLFSGGRFTCGSAIQLPIAAKTTNYAITASDYTVLADASGGAISIILPSAAGVAGTLYQVKRLNSGSNGVTVATTASQTIDGTTSRVLANQYDAITIVSDGANWFIL